MVYIIELLEYCILPFTPYNYTLSSVWNLVSNLVWQNNITGYLLLIPYITIHLPIDHLEVIWIINISEF
jgi:hypothetical protein